MAVGDEWRALGRELRSRRIALGYPKRKQFLDYKGVGPSQQRLMAALENAERDNYEEDTLLLAEHIYEWASGSVGRVLAGEQPTLIEDVAGVRVSRLTDNRTSTRLRVEIHELVNALPARLLLRLRNDIREMLAKQDNGSPED